MPIKINSQNHLGQKRRKKSQAGEGDPHSGSWKKAKRAGTTREGPHSTGEGPQHAALVLMCLLSYICFPSWQLNLAFILTTNLLPTFMCLFIGSSIRCFIIYSSIFLSSHAFIDPVHSPLLICKPIQGFIHLLTYAFLHQNSSHGVPSHNRMPGAGKFLYTPWQLRT